MAINMLQAIVIVEEKNLAPSVPVPQGRLTTKPFATAEASAGVGGRNARATFALRASTLGRQERPSVSTAARASTGLPLDKPLKHLARPAVRACTLL